MASRRRFSRGASRGPKNQIWSVIVEDSVAVGTGATVSFAIIQDTDWARITGQERATILRVRGWFSVSGRVVVGIVGDAAVAAYVSLHDDGVSPPNALLSASYTDEDVLWTGGYQFPLTATDTVLNPWTVDLDVKAMRKIHAGQHLSLTITNNMTVGAEISGVQRALIRIGGN